MAHKLGIELGIGVFGEGLQIFHSHGIVVNSSARVGKNCHLHGNNCIGNNGINDGAPVLGDNCTLGVGLKVLGEIVLGNNVTVAAGAVVVQSFPEDNIVLAGVPAKIVKSKS